VSKRVKFIFHNWLQRIIVARKSLFKNRDSKKIDASIDASKKIIYMV